MKKICILIFNLLFAGIIVAQKKLPNPRINKNEMEIATFILGDERLVFGGEFIYRFSLIKKLKIGAGVLYGADYDLATSSASLSSVSGYGAAFADIMAFTGHREKWSFGGQLGHGLYHSKDLGYYKLKAGIYSSISGNFRAIVSKKLLINTSLFIGYRNFHYMRGYPENNFGFWGLKAGIVF